MSMLRLISSDSEASSSPTSVHSRAGLSSPSRANARSDSSSPEPGVSDFWHLDSTASDDSNDPNASNTSDDASSGFGRFVCHSGGSDSDSDSSEDDPVALLQAAMKRQARTAKARAASLVARTTRKLAKLANLRPPEHPAESFREAVQATSSLNLAGQNSTGARGRRLRLLVSFLKGWCSAVVTFFNSFTHGHSNGEEANSSNNEHARLHHTITTSIVDDTNMKLSNIVLPEWKLSRTVAVMNNIQTFIAAYSSSKQLQHKVFSVHTPPVCLPKSDKSTLYQEVASRLMLFLGSLSSRFECLGLANVAIKARIQGLCICQDSLATNVAVLKYFRTRLFQKHQDNIGSERTDDQCVYPMLGVYCVIHQLALARKVILNSFGGFYSSIVRLGHLFETSTFRSQFRRALMAVLLDLYQYVPVSEKPAQWRDWQKRRNEICSIVSDTSGRFNKKRIQLFRELATFDNGNPEGERVVHWCTGDCCGGHGSQTHDEMSKRAFFEISKYYAILFSFGFPVPLAYRWVHAHRALQYVRAACKMFSKSCFSWGI